MNFYVINLKERTDQLEKIKSLYPDFNLIPIEAVKHINGDVGCFLSHKKCIQYAKDNKMKNIIVLEDDCCPLENFTEKIKEIYEFLNNYKNWDIFLGGAFCITPHNIEGKIQVGKDFIYKTNSGFCTHFIIYNESSYDFFLNLDETKCPIDNAWQGKLRCYITIPSQFTSFSNISNVEQSSFPKKIRINNYRLCTYIKTSKILDASAKELGV